MLNEVFISICIPSYNRPIELERLLNSIDVKEKSKIEIVICEDLSPKRSEICRVVERYKSNSNYQVIYVENEVNLGYDRNIRKLVEVAKGEYIIFMGDDDVFVENALDMFVQFLEENKNLSYVLKSHQKKWNNGAIEKFKYFSGNRFFSPGLEAYTTLFRKSVFISGFTIKREHAEKFKTDEFDGTLLYQLYLLAEVCLKYDSAYSEIILTELDESGIPYFGSSESEKDLYTPGEVTIDNSLNFIKGYYTITKFIDEKYNLNSTKIVMEDMSKYSYPIMSIQRKKGAQSFTRYCKELRKIGLGATVYYYIYFYALLLLGENICDNGIIFIKKLLGRTPNL